MAAAWGTEARIPPRVTGRRDPGAARLQRALCPSLPPPRVEVGAANQGWQRLSSARQADSWQRPRGSGKGTSGKTAAVIKQKNKGERRKRDKGGRKQRGKEQGEKFVEGSSLRQRSPS